MREAQDLGRLYASFACFVEGVPASLERALASKRSFDAVIGVLDKYMIFLASSMDFLKNSFDFLSRNLTLLLVLLGTPKVVSHISQVVPAHQTNPSFLCSALGFLSKILSILSLDLEEFLFVDLDSDQKEVEQSVKARIQENLPRFEVLFKELADHVICYREEEVAGFSADGLEFLASEEHCDEESSPREAACQFLKHLLVYFATSDQEAACKACLGYIFAKLNSAMEAGQSRGFDMELARAAEAALYFFQQSLADLKNEFDYSTVFVAIDFAKDYPDLLVHRVFCFLTEFVAKVPFLSEGVHSLVHAFVARHIEASVSPVVRFSAMHTLITVLNTSRQAILAKVNLEALLQQLHQMMNSFAAHGKEQLLVLFANVLLKFVGAVKGELGPHIDQVFRAVDQLSSKYCQGSAA